MYFLAILISLLASLHPVTPSPPCAQVTHSECGDDDAHLFQELTVPNKASCQVVCAAVGDKCEFSLYDNKPYARGNCRLYDEGLYKFVLHCNEIAGPKLSSDECNTQFPPDNSCQVYRQGKCDFSEPQENIFFSKWEICQQSCQSNSLCKAWQFLKEEGLCKILYEEEKKCTWEFSPRVPGEAECDVDPVTTSSKPPTTTTTAEITTTGTQGPCEQEGKNPIPGINCSHDFYCCDQVNGEPKICTCNDGLWYSQEIESCTWGDFMDPVCPDNMFEHNVDQFTRADHRCTDGSTCS